MCFGLTLVKTSEIEGYIKQIADMDTYADKLEAQIKASETTIEPAKLGTITLKEVWDLLVPIAVPYISDEIFSTTSKEEASKFSEETAVQFRTWVAENHDCDNFSFALQGYWSKGLYSFPFGIAWSSSHAFNIFIDNLKQIWIVEPQTNKWLTLEEAKSNKLYYPIRFICL